MGNGLVRLNRSRQCVVAPRGGELYTALVALSEADRRELQEGEVESTRAGAPRGAC